MELRDTVTFFATPAKFRVWLEKNHAKKTELWVGFYRKESGKPSITWPESVDQALAFGWIDGIRKRLDDESYVIRFTPRKSKSKWSKVNIARVAELTKLGLMAEAGLKAFETRDQKNSGYSYESLDGELTPEMEKTFRANKKAWAFYTSLAPGYQRLTRHWIMSAKREETRAKRLAEAIDKSARGINLRLETK